VLSTTPRHIRLYAVIAASEAQHFRDATRGPKVIEWGVLAAVTGKPEEETARAALRHARAVGRAFETCSSVVPFRVGVSIESEEALCRLLEENQKTLSAHLARFTGQAEMALKIKLPEQSPGTPAWLPLDLSRVRALASRRENICEAFKRCPGGRIFEGSYLLPREDVEAFWCAVEALRHASVAPPLFGSGPWAPYSFCNFTLRKEKVCAA